MQGSPIIRVIPRIPNEQHVRGRPTDISLLVEYFIHRYAKRAGKRIRGISKEMSTLLQSYDWPGNIREL
jgi:formate hydrogenlyase transcriptional activator